jgi:ribosome-dependent ATPase
VTIFISTHFMNEAERCDRMSMMHAGKVLDSDTPAALTAKRGAATLEEAFIGYLVEARRGSARAAKKLPAMPAGSAKPTAAPRHTPASACSACQLSVARDAGAAARPVRATLALVGSLVLMFVIGFGISMDVEDLKLRGARPRPDHAQPELREQLAGSRYFIESRPSRLRRPGPAHAQRRAGAGHRDPARLWPRRAARPKVQSAPGSTAPCPSAPRPSGYVQAMHQLWLAAGARALGVQLGSQVSLERAFATTPM